MPTSPDAPTPATKTPEAPAPDVEAPESTTPDTPVAIAPDAEDAAETPTPEALEVIEAREATEAAAAAEDEAAAEDVAAGGTLPDEAPPAGKRRSRTRWLALGLGAVVLLAGIAGAWWAFFDYGAKSAPAAIDPQALSTKVPTDPNALFGNGCGTLPGGTTDPAGPKAMTGKSVREIVAKDPQLSTLYTAVRKAGMLHSFDNSTGLTMLMPTNAAFDKVPTLQLKFALSNKSLITKILKYHVIAKTLNPHQLNLDGPFDTLEGSQLHVYGFGENLQLGLEKARVICGNIHAQNATIYLIDTVLIPS